MIRYIKGFFKHLTNRAIKFPAIIDHLSVIDKRSRINRGVKVVDSSVGRYSYIGGGSVIVNTDIGGFCSIASDVYIGLAGHTLTMLSTSPIFTEKYNGTGHSWIEKDTGAHRNQRTKVGNDVWIGYGAKIINGVKIGDGAVIAAGAVVTKDVAPYSIVGGVPARFIKNRFNDDIIKSLLKSQWWNLDENELKEKIRYFQTTDIDKNLIDCIAYPEEI